MDRQLFPAVVVLVALSTAASAVDDDSLLELSLEELMNVEVTSVSSKRQRAADAAAAIHVISADDIRRSGVTSIAEALRLAPGVQVGRFDGNKTAVSVRGFSGRFSNKLLVLMDGRTVHTPLYSGVFWDVQDSLLEDIDRIEVQAPYAPPGESLPGNPAPIPAVTAIVSNKNLKAETLTTFELGYRTQPTSRLSLDIAGFYSKIEDFRDGRLGTVTCEPDGVAALANPTCVFGSQFLLAPAQAVSTGDGESYGVEVAASWQPTDWLQFDTWYAWLDIQLHTRFPGTELLERLSPTHQASLRTSVALRHDLDLDVWLRYTDQLPALDVSDIFTADARIAWRPLSGLTLSIVGQHLFDSRFDEFESELQDTPRVELRRGVYAQASWPS